MCPGHTAGEGTAETNGPFETAHQSVFMGEWPRKNYTAHILFQGTTHHSQKVSSLTPLPHTPMTSLVLFIVCVVFMIILLYPSTVCLMAVGAATPWS